MRVKPGSTKAPAGARSGIECGEHVSEFATLDRGAAQFALYATHLVDFVAPRVAGQRGSQNLQLLVE
jgi:hypothetical protein